MGAEINESPLEFSDFSGGMTDDVFSAQQNEYNLIRNLLLTSDNKLLMRGGSVLNDSARAFTPSGAVRIGNLIEFSSQVLQRVASKLYYDDSGWTTILGPTGGDPVFGATSATNIAYGKWNNHLFLTSSDYIRPQKLYQDSVGDIQIRNASLPEPGATPSGMLDSVGATNLSYNYRVVFAYTYTTGGGDLLSFTDYSSFVEFNVSDPAGSPIGPLTPATITIPAGVWSVLVKENIDYTNVKLEIYRTEDDGVIYRKVGQADYPDGGFNDTTADGTAWDAGQLLYTEGGVLENAEIPKCKYLHTTEAFAYYANVKILTQTFRNRVYQSKQDDVDSVNEDSFAEVDDEITGISSYRSNPILFTEKSVFRLDGRIDNQGLGELRVEKISDTTGCVENGSIVQTLSGVFFAGRDGFYWTDGYQVQKISDNLNETYTSITSSSTKRSRIQGSWDSFNERVNWAIQYSGVGSDNDSVLVLDTRKGIKRRSCFVLLSGASFGPSALLFSGTTLYRGHYQGWLFKHDGTKFTDPKIDTSLDPANWGTETILWSIKDCARNFGTNFVRKWIPRIQVTTKNDGNLAIQPNGYNDGKAEARIMKPIRFLSGFVWGDPNFVWGDLNCIWNYTRVIEEFRWLPRKNIRTEYFQLELLNAEVILQNSDTQGNATVDAVGGTVTLDDATKAWISEADGYFIAFANDDYATKFPIRNRQSDSELILSTVTGLPTTGSYAWQIYGKQKGQIMHLISYLIHYSMGSDSQKGFRGSEDSGANA